MLQETCLSPHKNVLKKVVQQVIGFSCNRSIAGGGTVFVQELLSLKQEAHTIRSFVEKI